MFAFRYGAQRPTLHRSRRKILTFLRARHHGFAFAGEDRGGRPGTFGTRPARRRAGPWRTGSRLPVGLDPTHIALAVLRPRPLVVAGQRTGGSRASASPDPDQMSGDPS